MDDMTEKAVAAFELIGDSLMQIANRKAVIEPRDLFIAAALIGICGHPNGPVRKAGETGAEAHARWAIQVADATMTQTGRGNR